MHRLYKGTTLVLRVEAVEQWKWAGPRQTCWKGWD